MSRKLVELAGLACGRNPDAGLDAIRKMRDELARCEADHVARAIGQGWSWARIGRSLGISRQAIHRRYAQTPPERREDNGPRRPALSPRARLVLALARSEAAARRDAVTATEHLLMGLLQEGEGPAARRLMSSGLDLRVVRAIADVVCPSGLVHVAPSQMALSRNAQAVVSMAVKAAVERGDGQVTDADLLRALLTVPRSGALHLLRAAGAAPEALLAAPSRRPLELVA